MQLLQDLQVFFGSVAFTTKVVSGELDELMGVCVGYAQVVDPFLIICNWDA
jgi:hypothetical protein